MNVVERAVADLAAERDELAARLVLLDAALAALASLAVDVDRSRPSAAGSSATGEAPVGVDSTGAGGHRCDECGRTFSRPNGLSRHRTETHGVKAAPVAKPDTRPAWAEPGAQNYQCRDCGETFASPGQLGGHRSKHHRREHGTRSSYNHGCRCPDCTRAERDYMRDRRAVTPSAAAPPPRP